MDRASFYVVIRRYIEYVESSRQGFVLVMGRKSLHGQGFILCGDT